MKQFGIVFLSLLVLTTLSICQNSPAAPAQSSGRVVAQGAFPVKITKTLDSSKLKDGEAVQLETAGSFKLVDGTIVPKGSKVEGKIVMAKSRSKGDPESQLTLAFSKIELGEKEVMINGTVQAVYPPAEEPMGPNMANAGTSAGGSGAGGGSGGVGITSSTAGSNIESSNSQSVVNLKATGVQGMHELSLDDGVITSKGKNVKLGGGVRMVVHADFLG